MAALLQRFAHTRALCCISLPGCLHLSTYHHVLCYMVLCMPARACVETHTGMAEQHQHVAILLPPPNLKRIASLPCYCVPFSACCLLLSLWLVLWADCWDDWDSMCDCLWAHGHDRRGVAWRQTDGQDDVWRHERQDLRKEGSPRYFRRGRLNVSPVTFWFGTSVPAAVDMMQQHDDNINTLALFAFALQAGNGHGGWAVRQTCLFLGWLGSCRTGSLLSPLYYLVFLCLLFFSPLPFVIVWSGRRTVCLFTCSSLGVLPNPLTSLLPTRPVPIFVFSLFFFCLCLFLPFFFLLAGL